MYEESCQESLNPYYENRDDQNYEVAEKKQEPAGCKTKHCTDLHDMYTLQIVAALGKIAGTKHNNNKYYYGHL